MVSKDFAKKVLNDALDEATYKTSVAAIDVDIKHTVEQARARFNKKLDEYDEIDISNDATLKRILESHGYAVIKLTGDMSSAMTCCADNESLGVDNDCDSCPAKICLLNI